MNKITNVIFDDKAIVALNQQNEEQVYNDEVYEGEVIDEATTSSGTDKKPLNSYEEQEELRMRINNGEWDNLDDCAAFQQMTDEGKVMSRVEAIEKRIRQLEQRLPLLLQKQQTPAYVQMLKRIKALEMTKTGILDIFYRNLGQKDIDNGK